jgi:hypothetical protein
MFVRLATSDAWVICRGLVIFLFVVVLGVAVAENQINTLTQQQDCVQVFNVRHGQTGIYTAYVLGNSYSVSAVYQVAKVMTNDTAIIVEVTGYSFAIPTYVYIDSKKIILQLDLWVKQFVEEAFRTKHTLEDYMREIRQRIAGYSRQFR